MGMGMGMGPKGCGAGMGCRLRWWYRHKTGVHEMGAGVAVNSVMVFPL